MHVQSPGPLAALALTLTLWAAPGLAQDRPVPPPPVSRPAGVTEPMRPPALPPVTPPAPAEISDLPAEERPRYRLHPGDTILISVWREQELTLETSVRPDGGISFPLAGDIHVAGLSVEEVRQQIAQRLEEFIPDPEVAVIARQLLGNVVYVVGRVARPGEFPLRGRVDVLQALAIAGGTTTFADLDDMRILRRDAEGVQKALEFDYSDVVRGRRLGQNILLQPGDTVVVP
jgi:polysaccharide export outer membrane protein